MDGVNEWLRVKGIQAKLKNDVVDFFTLKYNERKVFDEHLMINELVCNQRDGIEVDQIGLIIYLVRPAGPVAARQAAGPRGLLGDDLAGAVHQGAGGDVRQIRCATKEMASRYIRQG